MDGQVLLWSNVAGCVAGGLVGLVFAAIAWRNRDVTVALPYGALALSISAWGFLNGALLLSSDVVVATWLNQLIRVVTAIVPILWFRFTTVYTGDDHFRTRPLMAVLWTITGVYVLLALTWPLHDLLVTQVTFVTVGGITAPVEPQDLPFWAFVGYAYLLIAIGFGLLVRFLLRARNLYRRQTAAIVVGSTVPLLGNVIYLLGIVPHPALDPTPMLFGVNGLIIGWALFQYDFMEVTPVATEALVDDLPDPVLVVDDTRTIVEYNEAAAAAFGSDSLVGSSVDSLPIPSANALASTSQVTLPDGGGRRVYTPRISPIEDRHGNERGQLLVLRDVTVQQRRFDRIEALQATTQQFLGATSVEEIAHTAVEFFECELQIPVVVWYRRDDRRLVPAAASSVVESADTSLSAVGPRSTLWECSRRDEITTADPSTAGLDTLGSTLTVERVLVVPVDPFGVFCLGISDPDDATEDRQMAHILQGTMVAALTRVEREAQLRESRQAVDRRTEQIEFFSGVLRHNIRNGMQVVHSHVDLLGDRTGPMADPYLETISDWADDLIDLTREVREITTAVTAPAQEQRRPVSLTPVLSARLDALEAEYDVTVDRPELVDEVIYANDLLGKVLDSLLRNAVEHDDADHSSIDVTVVQADDVVEVRIADEGPGISDDLKESVFDRDVGTRQTANGFGLYFVSVMMDLYDGDVWFEDNEPRGTVAVVAFQRVRSA